MKKAPTNELFVGEIIEETEFKYNVNDIPESVFDDLTPAEALIDILSTGKESISEKYTLEELWEKGINDSMIHEDFMIGTEDLSIVGITKEGKRVQIFKDGNWAF